MYIPYYKTICQEKLKYYICYQLFFFPLIQQENKNTLKKEEN